MFIKRLFTMIVQDCTEKLDSHQTEGNKDCEAHRSVNFFVTHVLR